MSSSNFEPFPTYILDMLKRSLKNYHESKTVEKENIFWHKIGLMWWSLLTWQKYVSVETWNQLKKQLISFMWKRVSTAIFDIASTLKLLVKDY